MDFHARSVDGTIPVIALLFPDEALLAEQDGVGLYDGNMKSPNHQSGSINITSHRLIYIDGTHPRRHSLEFPLDRVTQTEHYAGFLTSSPKIIIFLRRPSLPATTSAANPGEGTADPGERETTIKWECEICGNKNVSIGLVPSTICQLCGVPRSKSTAVSISSPSQPSSSQPLQIPSSPHSGVDHALSTSHSLPASAFPIRTTSPVPSLSNPDAESNDGQVSCPVCTFLNHPSLRNCEMCGTPLSTPGRSSQRSDVRESGRSRAMKSEPSSRPSSSDKGRPYDERGDVIKISFRRGGDKALYASLKTALEAKVWRVVEPAPVAKNRTGIHGLVQRQQTTVETTTSHMQTALHDLEGLMAQAKEMVQLAESFNRSLREHEAARKQLPEDAQFIIGSSMARLGLGGGQTNSEFGSGKQGGNGDEELAKELGRLLTGDEGLMRNRGMIALDEVWGAWNRARGIALIPPSTFIQVLPLLPQHTSPQIELRTFHSNLKVLHTPWYSQRSFSSRLLTYLDAVGPKTTVQVAEQENLSVGLVQEMIHAAEREGKIVRDVDNWDGGGGGRGGSGSVNTAATREVLWWRNYFEGYVWDGD